MFLSVLFVAAVFPNIYLDEETIVGTVVVLEKDEEDNITAVGINVTVEVEEEEGFYEINEIYWVDNNEKGEEILTLVGETIQATGSVTVNEDGEYIMKVLSYIILKMEDDEE